jgi:hypothetical protein
MEVETNHRRNGAGDPSNAEVESDFYPGLFDLPSRDTFPSHHETEASRDEEAAWCASPTETTAASGEAPSDDHPDRFPTLAAVAQATTAAAHAALGNAITAARDRGHSWRAIAASAPTPHQTLHRCDRRTVAQQEKD